MELMKFRSLASDSFRAATGVVVTLLAIATAIAVCFLVVWLVFSVVG